jgi:uncharacterized protein (DUF111 family)
LKFRDILAALFLMPSSRPGNTVRCITHEVVFSDSMEMSFHETMNLGCRWEKLER